MSNAASPIACRVQTYDWNSAGYNVITTVDTRHLVKLKCNCRLLSQNQVLPFHLRLGCYGVIKNGVTCAYANVVLIQSLRSLIYNIIIIVGPMELITSLVVSFDGYFSYIQKERNVSINHIE